MLSFEQDRHQATFQPLIQFHTGKSAEQTQKIYIGADLLELLTTALSHRSPTARRQLPSTPCLPMPGTSSSVGQARKLCFQQIRDCYNIQELFYFCLLPILCPALSRLGSHPVPAATDLLCDSVANHSRDCTCRKARAEPLAAITHLRLHGCSPSVKRYPAVPPGRAGLLTSVPAARDMPRAIAYELLR